MTGIGPVAVRCPRVRDRVSEGSERIRLSSAILPPYARRSKSLEVLIPLLYPLPQGHFHRRLRGGAGRAGWQGRRRAFGGDRLPAQRGLVGRVRTLEQARSLGQTLRLLLGRWHPRAGSARGSGAMSARHYRGHT